jgi:tetratricopeptide (TPR) repeat protein
MSDLLQSGKLALQTPADSRERLAHLQDLYDRNLFLQAYRETAALWTDKTNLEGLSTEELILASRFAYRLGGYRLSRWLLRVALAKDPTHPRVRYYTRDIGKGRAHLLHQLREFQAQPDLGGEDTEMRASWFAAQAQTWGTLRDFTQAFQCLERAKAFKTDDSWLSTCEAQVLMLADRREEALQAADRACQERPGTPYALAAKVSVLLSLGRVEEAAEGLDAEAHPGCESHEVALNACWYMCALAETKEGAPRDRALTRARELIEFATVLAPLADRDSNTQFARMHVDIAELAGNHAGMERWLSQARSPFSRQLLANLHANPGGARVLLPYRREIQEHNTCLPASISSALAAQAIVFDAQKIAADITVDGTAGWAAADWLKGRDLQVRFFTVTPQVAANLIRNGVAFVATWEADHFAHALAVVGVDEAAQTLLVHDPQCFRISQWLVNDIGRGQAPMGPLGLVAVPRERADLLDQILPADSAVQDALQEQYKAMRMAGPSAALPIVAGTAERFPGHLIVRFMQAYQAEAEGRTGEALAGYQELLNEYPDCPMIRARLITACRALGNTSLTLQTLHDVVERAVLPGVRAQQEWDYPPERYVCEYADLQRSSDGTRKHARSLLESVLRRNPNYSEAWHVLGDLLWDERRQEGNSAAAMIAYRLACCNAVANEHYARAYCNALVGQGREKEGLQWLEERTSMSGSSALAAPFWTTWIGALEDLGHPARALAACDRAMEVHDNASDLLEFAVAFLARMGEWERAEKTLHRLEATGNVASFHQAATQFHGMRGNLRDALEHAEAWVAEMPRYMPARYKLLDLVRQRDGFEVAIQRSLQWMEEQPRHEEFEEVYFSQPDETGSERRKYHMLRRRAQRNPADAWAWRELAACGIRHYNSADKRSRQRIGVRIVRFLAECDRTAPDAAATLRVHAHWQESQSRWPEAVDAWTQAIERDPENLHAYQRAWACGARLRHEERLGLWHRLEPMFLGNPGHLWLAPEIAALHASWFGAAETEQIVNRWREQHPDDPEVLVAAANLLLGTGHGRFDAQRALTMLEPATERFPYHLKLRLLLAQAHAALQQSAEQEKVLLEAIRRTPTDFSAVIQMAWIHERAGRLAETDQLLAQALEASPCDSEIWQARIGILIGRGSLDQARKQIEDGLRLMPKNVTWRREAIAALMECGGEARAVEVAREGTDVYPRGAYLWLLRVRTLHQAPDFAKQGEVESCLRRSVALNASFYEPADWLAILLADQRRYSQAEEVIVRILPRLEDPSPASGRLAWIARQQQGRKREALNSLAAVLRDAPWYEWGWSMLIDWLFEDKAWEQARDLLRDIPGPLRTNTRFRIRRLKVLDRGEAAGSVELDKGWEELLRDFPENIPLHLERYDLLKEQKRISEATALLQAVRIEAPNNPFLLTRMVDVLLRESKEGKDEKKEEALQMGVQVWFTPAEDSPWPATTVRDSLRRAGLAPRLYEQARGRLERGLQPTHQALRLLAEHAAETPDPLARRILSLGRSTAYEAMTLLEMVDRAPWGRGGDRVEVLTALNEKGHRRMVVTYWKSHRAIVEAHTECWAQTGRALLLMRRNREARKLFSGWRQRRGVLMWMITNYVMALPRNRNGLREARDTCRDALALLPHDHCARYLVNMQAEAQVLLGDPSGFLETWNSRRSYFEGQPGKEEWMTEKSRRLLGDLPMLARFLEQGDRKLYRSKVRSLRWEAFWSPVQGKVGNALKGGSSFRWGFFLLWLLLTLLRECK